MADPRPAPLEAAGEVLERVAGVPREEVAEVVRRDRRSNCVDEVRLRDGRVLVIKTARETWVLHRFSTSRAAARLLRARSDVLAPDHLNAPDGDDERPMLAYWWIPGMTLKEAWEGLSEGARVDLVRDWGGMIRRIHGVGLPGHGPLLDAIERPTPLAAFLGGDLGERLLPAARAHWPAAVTGLAGLQEALPDLVRRSGEAVLLHNDLFDQNVLCRSEAGAVRCRGVLDLEDAFAGPAEADLAKTEVLHGPLFGQPWDRPRMEPLLEGYGRTPDPLLLAWFRAYHLVNMGLHAAGLGLHDHAGAVAATVHAEVRALGSGSSHLDVHAGVP